METGVGGVALVSHGTPDSPAPAGGGGDRPLDRTPAAAHRRWPILVCIAIYLGLAVVEVVPSSGLGPGHMAGPGSADQINDIWWLSWAQFALAHSSSPPGRMLRSA
jgi:hypothetical protein